jgi:peptidoglycan/LPS O-acetylase OafA/YrhL
MQHSLHPHSYNTHIGYRSDIDGLRGIAVLSVVFFHVFPNQWPSGFIGVDIFFVISGYLISSIIFKNLSEGTFNFAVFYRRRIARLFPALILVLTFCILVGWLILLSDEYKELGKHIFAATLFSSNWLLWFETGYFDTVSGKKILLHLWSLGVEEQFYIVWPLLVGIFWKLKSGFSFLLGSLIVLSFIAGLYEITTNKPGAFYYSHLRFWELLVGCLIAYIEFLKLNSQENNLLRVYQTIERTVFKYGALSGTLLIIVGWTIIDKNQIFPGYLALLPTLGAALIILNPQSIINRNLLSCSLLVKIGLISFPLYLWHWPLLSLARIYEGTTPTKDIRIGLVLIAVILSWLTYRLIETPLRFGRSSLALSSFLCFYLIILGIAGLFIYCNQGLPNREHARLVAYEGDTGHGEFHKYIDREYFPCKDTAVALGSLKWNGLVQCAESKKNGPIDIVLIGDSHAEHLFIGMAKQLPDKNVAFYVRNSPPYLDNPEYFEIFRSVAASQSIKKVVLTMWWAGRADKTTEAKIGAAADFLIKSGKDVYITDDVPNFPFDPEKCQGRRWMSTKDLTCSVHKEQLINQPFVQMLRAIAQENPAIKLTLTQKLLCGQTECSMAVTNKLLYRDYNHLNINGSLLVGSQLAVQVYGP